MEFWQVQFASIILISQRPVLRVAYSQNPSKKGDTGTTHYIPNLGQFILVKSALIEDVKRSLTRNESFTLRVPSPKDLIVHLLLSLAERPWDLGRSRSSLSLIVLQERLLEVLLLLELRRTSGVVRHRWVSGKQRTRHHLKTRVNETCYLRH